MNIFKNKWVIVTMDVLALLLSVLVSHYLRFDGIARAYAFFLRAFVNVLPLYILLFMFSYMVFGLYNRLWRYAGISEYFTIVAANTVAITAFITFMVFLNIGIYRGIYVLLWVFNNLFITAIRLSFRGFKRLSLHLVRSRSKSFIRTLIVGAGDAGAMTVKELLRHKELGMLPVGFIDDDPKKQGQLLMGIPVLGQRDDIPGVVAARGIQQIIIAISSCNGNNTREIIEICKQTECKLKILPSVSELIDGKVTATQIRDVQIEDLLGRDPVQLDMDGIAEYIGNKVVMVTGGGGSIGSELCRQISRFNPSQLIIFDIYENGAYELQMELNRKYPDLDLEVLIGSVRDRARVDSVFRKYRPHVVFHAAAHKHVPLMEKNPTEAIKNNVFGTMNVAEAADQYGARKFVLISTDKAVNPTNIMGASKRVAEMLIQSLDKYSKTDFVAVRFGNVLGSNGSVIPLFKKQIADGGPVTVTHPEITRFFMTIPEAVQLVIQAGAMAKGGEIFILDMGEPVKIDDLARDLIRLSGYKPDVDIKIEYVGLRPGEKLYEELMMEDEGLTSTGHKKIFIAPPTFSNLAGLKQELEKLKFIMMGSDENLIAFIERLVPTYKRVI